MYGTAVILFLFVLIAAVLMISSSFQTSVSERIRFFGMLRCLGASRKQIKRFVIKEGLTYCKKAIPAGAAVGILVIWGLSGLLRGLSPEYFADMPYVLHEDDSNNSLRLNRAAHTILLQMFQEVCFGILKSELPTLAGHSFWRLMMLLIS